MKHRNLGAFIILCLICLLIVLFVMLTSCGRREETGVMRRFDLTNREEFGGIYVRVIKDRLTGQEYLCVCAGGGLDVVPIEK